MPCSEFAVLLIKLEIVALIFGFKAIMIIGLIDALNIRRYPIYSPVYSKTGKM
uniref:7TM_GPCR_Srx domain-containing protein n=1 Tax=Heterorhabditis bacteriophora TaxID=37862 RepID=A0A1I7WIA6_HETBA